MAFSPFASTGFPNEYNPVTPSDTTLLSGCSYLRVGVAGNLVLQGKNSSTPVTIPAAANEYVPFGSGMVMAATTATGIVAFQAAHA